MMNRGDSDSAHYIDKINKLRIEKNAIILAHYYQVDEIQDIADYVGDSLALAQKAKSTNADIIVLAGVHFMAETAKILNPGKKVLVPDLNASCSLAESCPPESFENFVNKHPDHIVVTYVNCSAEIKALSDIVCTSSNARKVVESIPAEKPIIFAPDRNLGEYLIKVTGREMLLWDGACLVHEAFSMEKILSLHKQYPQAQFIAHPESKTEVLNIASYIGSTAGMLNYVKQDSGTEYIVATEAGILHEMQRMVPEKQLIPAPVDQDNSCSCAECHYMKMNTIEKLYRCLRDESPEVQLAPNIITQALAPIDRMLALS